MKKTKYEFKPPNDDPNPEAKVGVESIDNNPKLKEFVMKQLSKKNNSHQDMQNLIRT
jgi:hypothetical protein